METSLTIESRLRAAVQEDAFELSYQPQYDLRLGPIMAVQVHLTWRDPAGGLVDASQAFTAAESAGTSVTLLSSILNRSLRNVSEFRYSAGLDLLLGVPLPAFVLRHPDLPEVVERALGTWRLRAGRIVFQVSDTDILATNAGCRDNLLRLKRLGVRLCLNDPAVSLSSLGFLATLPFQEIRLELSSMVAMAEAAEAASLAAAVATAKPNAPPPPPKSGRIPAAFIGLARQLSLEVVACDVPNEAAANSLKELGCEYIQADFMGPALDADAFVSRFG
jgi:EAL domain-containing protein (putative c-di-GMP-specific phosphodiesterase class I)